MSQAPISHFKPRKLQHSSKIWPQLTKKTWLPETLQICQFWSRENHETHTLFQTNMVKITVFSPNLLKSIPFRAAHTQTGPIQESSPTLDLSKKNRGPATPLLPITTTSIQRPLHGALPLWWTLYWFSLWRKANALVTMVVEYQHSKVAPNSFTIEHAHRPKALRLLKGNPKCVFFLHQHEHKKQNWQRIFSRYPLLNLFQHNTLFLLKFLKADLKYLKIYIFRRMVVSFAAARAGMANYRILEK